MKKKICAVILAAGQGKRLGKPKIFGKAGDQYFPEVIVDKLLSVDIKNISIVTAGDFDKDQFNFGSEVKWVINPEPEKGMLTSVYWGIKANPYSDTYMIIPVDHPLISTSTYRLMKHHCDSNPGKIIKVCYNEIFGHPVIIPKELAENIRNADLPGGLNAIIESSNLKIDELEVEDSGILKNINTKEDLKIHFSPKGNKND